jgi:hypothetical protein
MNNMANIIMNNEDEIEFKTSGRNIIYWWRFEYILEINKLLKIAWLYYAY